MRKKRDYLPAAVALVDHLEKADKFRIKGADLCKVIQPYFNQKDLPRRLQETAKYIVDQQLAPLCSDAGGYWIAKNPADLDDAAKALDNVARQHVFRAASLRNMAKSIRLGMEARRKIYVSYH